MTKNKTRKPKLIFRTLAVISLVMMVCLNLIAQKPELVVEKDWVLLGPSVAFSSDGNVLAASSSFDQIKIWDVKSGKSIRTLEKAGPIFPVVFCSNKRLIAGGGYKNIYLWDSVTGKILRRFPHSEDIMFSLSFSPDGKRLISSSRNDSKIKIWDVENGKELLSFEGHQGGVEKVLFGLDGKTLVSNGRDNTIKLWAIDNSNTIKEIYVFTGHSSSVRTVNFSSDGKLLVSGSEDKTIKLWDLENKKEIITFIRQSSAINFVAFTSNGKNIVSGNAFGEIKRFDLSGKEILGVKKDGGIGFYAYSPVTDVFAGIGSSLNIWNIETGQMPYSFEIKTEAVDEIALSSDKQILAVGGETFRSTVKKIVDGRVIAEPEFSPIKLWNLNKGTMNLLSGDIWATESLKFSPDGKILASIGRDAVIRFWDTSLEKEITNFIGNTEKNFTTPIKPKSELYFSPDGKFLLSKIYFKDITKAENDPNKIVVSLTIREVVTGKKVWSHQASGVIYQINFTEDGKVITLNQINNSSIELAIKDFINNIGEVKTLVGHKAEVVSETLSDDHKLLATACLDKTVKIWDIKSSKEVQSINGNFTKNTKLKFSSDGKMLAIANYSDGFWDLGMWSVENGKNLKNIKLPIQDSVQSLVFDGKGENIIVGGNSSVKIWNVKTGEELLSLVSVDKKDWVVTTPDGRFDTNKLENPQGLHWIMPDAPFTPLSFEIFMRDYYEPNLLPRLLKCTEENSCETEFKPVRNLTELNRTQPTVRIAAVKAGNSPDEVLVTVEAEDAVSEYQWDKQGKPLRSGVFDLRLFRDGQLVGYKPDGEGEVGVDKNGKFTQTFTVKLPKNRDLPQNGQMPEFVFTAYAFNSDRVKSETAQAVYTLPKPLPTVKGSAYIVTIGVNANEDSSMRLFYAANDARLLPEELAKRLPKDKYQPIVQIPLISDYDKAGNLTEKNATKAKIKAVLDKLAGNDDSKNVLKDVPNAESLKKVQPEDLVLIAFSGHGYTDLEGIFYFVPYDIGTKADISRKSISSNELSFWLRDIDAGEMMMIVDACHSAAAVQGAGFKPGPMGSRGLGQLAYDKDMKILSATQADNVALESGSLQHGLLSYALIQDGLISSLADADLDKKLFSAEWLSYAEKRVPELYQEVKDGRRGVFYNGQSITAGAKGAEIVGASNRQKSNLNLQQPSLFDFKRRARNSILFTLP